MLFRSEANYQMFWAAIRLLLADDAAALGQLDQLRDGFAATMQRQLTAMWVSKIGLGTASPSPAAAERALVDELLPLLALSAVDPTIFFRRLSDLPEDLAGLQASFYRPINGELDRRWQRWLQAWRAQVDAQGSREATAAAMKRVNPSITWREWLVAPAYQAAEQGERRGVQELHAVFLDPYRTLPPEIADRHDRLRPLECFQLGGVSHYSCSS